MRSGDDIPLFRSWRHWYILVMLFLVLQIIGFHFFTQYFS